MSGVLKMSKTNEPDFELEATREYEEMETARQQFYEGWGEWNAN